MGACWKLGAPERVVPLHFLILTRGLGPDIMWLQQKMSGIRRKLERTGRVWREGRMDGFPYLRSRSKEESIYGRQISVAYG